jgi:hypothetical protein
MDDILLTPRIAEPRSHPLDDAASLHDLAQDHGPGVCGQPLGAALDPQGLVEARGEGR